MADLKPGDRATATVLNGTPGGLKVEGTVISANEVHVRVTTQFGVDMALPRADVKLVPE